MNTSDRHSIPDSRRRLARRAGLVAAAMGLVVAVTAGAAPQLRTVEECIESGTRTVSLPGTANGSVSASPCTGCPSLRLAFDARTVFQVGKQQVTYAKFREAAANGDLRLDIYYQPQTRVLTRLRVPDAGNGK